jgi:hypothetical protein
MKLPLPVDDNDIATRVTTGNGRKASFWTSSWIKGGVVQTCQTERKNMSVREAVFDAKLIDDIAHNLNAEILRDFVQLWQLP